MRWDQDSSPLVPLQQDGAVQEKGTDCQCWERGIRNHEVGLQHYFPKVHGWMQPIFKKCWKRTLFSEMLSRFPLNLWKVWCSQRSFVFRLSQKTIKQTTGQINDANPKAAQFILYLLPSRTTNFQEFGSTTAYSLAKKRISIGSIGCRKYPNTRIIWKALRV